MISLIVAVFISVMLLALVIQLKPGWLRITEKIVCRKGSRLIIETAVHSHHQPGENALGIYEKDENGVLKSAGFKVVSLFWLIIFTFCLPASFVLVNLIINTVKIETQ